VIFPGDGGGEFDDLLLAEFAAQAGIEVVFNRCRRFGERDSEVEGEPFSSVEGVAFCKAREAAELSF
jgi:hypothetical protein